MTRARMVGALTVAVLASQLLTAQAPQSDSPQAIEKRLADLEARQQAILKELQELKLRLQARPAPAAAAPALPVVAGAISVTDAAARGDAKAVVTLVEFSDFECPFCARYTRDTYDLIQREYVDTGKIRYVFKNLPLEGVHPRAFGAAVAGECARAQGKFWEMHDQMFANQRALTQPGLVQSATTVGLDVASFERCLASEKPQAKVRQDLADAARFNANATPTFLIGVASADGKMTVVQRIQGAKPFTAFKATLDAVLSSPGLQQQ